MNTKTRLLFLAVLPILLSACGWNGSFGTCPIGHVCENSNFSKQAPASWWGFTSDKAEAEDEVTDATLKRLGEDLAELQDIVLEARPVPLNFESRPEESPILEPFPQVELPVASAPEKKIPTVKAPSGPAKVRSKKAFRLVSIGDGYFCPEAIKGERQRNWKRPGGNAFAGTIADGVHYLSVPTEVKRLWNEELTAKPLTTRTLREGERFCQMMYSTRKDGVLHHVLPNVKNGSWVNDKDAKNGARVVSVTYDGYDWELVIPDICNNVSYVARKTTASSVTPVPKVEGEKVSPAPVATSNKLDPYYKLRVRPWLWESFPPDLQKRIREINEGESDATYAFDKGAISRDLNSSLISLWKQGKASTVRIPVTFEVKYPGSVKWEGVTAKPGDHPKHPELVYWEKKIQRAKALKTSSQFAVRLEDQGGCRVLYPRSYKGTRLLDTRLASRLVDSSELSQSAERNRPGMNLNAIFSCLAS